VHTSKTVGRRGRQGKDLPYDAEERVTAVVVIVTAVFLAFLESNNVRVNHLSGDVAFIPK
jgi:hypothetical protein